MNLEVYKMRAFTNTPEGGNPAGVVLKTQGLQEQDMLEIAKEVGFSETAFVFPSDSADFKVRFFTPAEEVDLCGHATIATFSVLLKEGIVKPGKYKQETKAGVLEVLIDDDGTIFMDQNTPEYHEIVDKKIIAESLNIDVQDLLDEAPVQVTTTGLKDIMIGVKGLEELRKIEGDMKKISDISEKYNATGYHVFTFETIGEATAQCRNFAPLYDIPEEAATGTASGAVSCYIYKYKKDRLEKENGEYSLIFEQGYTMDSPSMISVKIKEEQGKICKVQVGGKAVTF